MPDSPRDLFLAAAAGNVSPILLKWWAQEGISVPGETWAATCGWVVLTLGFAAFAGYVATSVWQEKRTRRAFMIGLALPYILWGLLADVSGALKVRRAIGQSAALFMMWDLVPLKVFVVAEDTGKPLPNARTQVYPARDKEPRPIAASSLGTYALPAGKYEVHASAPGYLPVRFAVVLPATQEVVIKLQRSPWWNEFLNGAKAVVWPHASSSMSYP